ncbi:MAG: DUF5060 domain-containing protein [Fimbriimonas sp.]
MILLPEIPTVSPPHPAVVATYDIVEFAVDAGGPYRNPFDPDEVAVDGAFTLPDGTRLNLPAFWDGERFRMRFCPPKPGAWTLVTAVATPSGVRRTVPQTFQVSPSRARGFVRRSEKNRRYFRFDDGTTFLPIGLNLCWPDGRGLASYDARFARLRQAGGNFARIWTTQERRLETPNAGLGRYDLAAAGYYDELFRRASKHGVRTMWTFDDYRVLAKTDFFNAHWDKSPYNAANGGPLKEPSEFFTSEEARRLYKRKLRYLVARYTAFTSIAMWELWNEQDHIPKPGVPLEWFREMTESLRDLDPYKHVITTSYSWDDKPEVWQSPALGLVQRHMYGQGDTVDFVGEIVRNAAKLDRFEKPHFIGEFGITWKEPDIALDKGKRGTPLHDALWASVMTGHAGGAMTWWWDNYLEPLDLWDVFSGISRFVAPIDFASKNFQPLTLTVAGLDALAMQDRTTGETILWLHDPASNWQNDAKGIEPPEWRDVEVTIPGVVRGRVEVWDTRTGKIVGRPALRGAEGGRKVKVPAFRRDIALRVRSG